MRILIAKAGLDGHDRGAKVIARALRDAGFEVVYTGLHQSPEQIVHAAVHEDVVAIGLSSHSGAHMTTFPAIIDELNKLEITDVVVFGGGVIPAHDVEELLNLGVGAIFGPGTSTTQVIDWLRATVVTFDEPTARPGDPTSRVLA